MERIVFAVSLVVLLFTAAGGPGWTDASTHAVLATHLERTAASPLYGMIAGVAAYVPVGEPGFRLAILGALIGAFTLAGVIRAARALLPKDPIAGLAGAALLFFAPPFRDAAGFARPSILVACGLVWTVAFAIDHHRAPLSGRCDHARTKDARSAAAAMAFAAIVVGSAPWLGMPVLVAVGVYLARSGASRSLLIVGAGAIGLATVLWFLGAVGRMPDPDASFGAFVATSGRGAAAVLVGVGLLGVAFGAATKLAHAAWLAIVIALVVAHSIFIDPDATPVLALFAIGAAVLPSAVVRVLPERRHVVAVVASVPLVGAGLLAGPAFGVDDPGDTPSRLATDLVDEVPPGPGVFIATRPATLAALEYAHLVAGSRPDLALAPPSSPTDADVIVKNVIVTGRIAASDVFVFGRLDPKRAYPRGRGFQLLGTAPTKLAAIRPPAKYRSASGELESVLLALELTRYEAGYGRLDAAAHAAGLARTRFNAADLALLSTAQASHPPLFGIVPMLGTPVGPWLLDLFGDDLAWVADLEQPDVDGPPPRRLHALWRKLLTGQIKIDDPAIAALGPEAVAATTELVKPAPPPAQ